MTLELPFELWMNITSYLPPGYVHRLLTVNRPLFHLAMEDRYSKFEATTANLRTLETIRSPTRLQYVKRLEIRSSPHHHNPPTKRTGLFLSARRPETDQSVEPLIFMNALTDALSYCPQLEEVTLGLYDLEWESAFSNLLSTLLSLKAGSIHKLNINANLRGLFSLLNFFSQSSPLPHLESLSLMLTISRPFKPQPPLAGLPSGVAALIKAHKHSLRTLIFHQIPQVTLGDISPMFDTGCLPYLKRLELSMPFIQLLPLESLEKFLSLNSRTLECFCLKIKHPYAILEVNDISPTIVDILLPNLHLPALSEFVFSNVIRRRCLPPFDSFTPNITRLELSVGRDRDFSSLLENLRQSRVALRSFRIEVHYLKPDHLDQLALHLPSLKSLTIYYHSLTCVPDRLRVTSEEFANEFHDRKYTSWSLKYLRLAKRSNCQGGHASPVVNAAVAKCMVEPHVVDVDNSCECPSWSLI